MFKGSNAARSKVQSCDYLLLQIALSPFALSPCHSTIRNHFRTLSSLRVLHLLRHFLSATGCEHFHHFPGVVKLLDQAINFLDIITATLRNTLTAATIQN